MSAPIKPWEGGGVNSRATTPLRSSLTPRPSVPYGSRPNSLNPSSCCDGVQNSSKNPPPVPGRPQRSSIASTSGYGGTYGAYGGYSYGSGFGTGMYGSSYGGNIYGGNGGLYGGGYGGYGSYNRFGSYGAQTMSSPFVRRAEESSQAAFQSVESIVHAFGSISMMLESTHFAMLNTFRAVLGAADHFSRLKTHLISAVGALAIFKTIKALWRKLLYILGLMRNTGVENEVWTEAQSSVVAASAAGRDGKPTRSWPIVMFFAVVLGVPWVIWKLLRSLISEEEDSRDWMTGAGDHVLARVEYDFVGEAEDELSVTAGTVIKMAPKDKQPRIRGWLLATVDGEREGIVPANYVKILGLQRGNKSRAQEPSNSVTPMAPSSAPSTSNPPTTASNVDLANDLTQASNAPSASQNANSFEQSLNDVNFEMPDESELDLIVDGQT